LFGVFLVNLSALGLSVRPEIASNIWAFIPLQSKPAKTIHKFSLSGWYVTFLIGILDPQDELSPSLAG
jgi:hypothetical protein